MFVHRFSGKLRLLALAITLGISLTLALPLTASANTGYKDKGVFKETDLVTDAQDPNLVNSWGIVAVPHNGPFWIVGNEASVASAYNGKGKNLQSVIKIGTDEGPTGVVLNQTNDFVISKNGKYAPARLLFATESG